MRFAGAIWSPPPSVFTKNTRSSALPKRGEAPSSVTSVGFPPALWRRRGRDRRTTRPSAGNRPCPCDRRCASRRGEDGVEEVVPGLLRHEARRAGGVLVGPGDPDRPERLVVPGRVDDRLRIPRPRGEVLEVVGLAGQTARRAIGQVLHVDVAERLIGDAAAVGRDGDPAQHADRERRASSGKLRRRRRLHEARQHVDAEAHGVRRLARVLDVERNHRRDLLGGSFSAARRRDQIRATDSAARPKHDRLRVGIHAMPG